MAHRIWKKLPANTQKQHWASRAFWDNPHLTWSQHERARPMTVKRWKHGAEPKLWCHHWHVPRWYCMENYVRPERTRVKQLLRSGLYEEAETSGQRTWRHQGAYSWA